MVEYEYAKALYDLAIEENKLDIFLDNIYAVVDSVQEQRDFIRIMSSPSIEKKDKINIIKKVFGNLDESFFSFLYVLVNNQRFNLIDVIATEYRNLYNTHHNILKVEIISSELLSNDQLKQIIKRLEQRYPGKDLKIENTVNPKILGGLQIICNGESLDISLKGQLLKLKEAL